MSISLPICKQPIELEMRMKQSTNLPSNAVGKLEINIALLSKTFHDKRNQQKKRPHGPEKHNFDAVKAYL